MKLFILGNSGTGKSALIEGIRHFFPGQIVAVDDFRIKYGNFKWDGEQRAIQEFIKAIALDSRNQIIECSGAGRTGDLLRMQMIHINDTILVYILDADSQVCIERNENKFWPELKMPEQKLEMIRRNIRNHLSIKDHYLPWRAEVLRNENAIQQLKNIAMIKGKIVLDN